jgi:hypothetical protein
MHGGEEKMKRWLLICAFGGQSLLGCYQGTEPDVAPPSSRPSMGGQDGSMSSTEGGDASDTAPRLDDSGGPLELDKIALTAPAGWQRTPPSSSFVMAEFVLPRAEGDDADGRLTVSTAGGGLEANIGRWKGQFNPLAKEAPQEEIDVAGMKVTTVDFSGDFNDQRGPFAPAVQRPDYRMIASIIPVEDQLYFIKATGPQKTMAAHADEIHEFIHSVQRRQ